MMAFRFLPFLTCCFAPFRSCFHLSFGGKPKATLDTLHPYAIKELAEYMDFFSLSSLMAVKGKYSEHHLTICAAEALKERLIPTNQEITWFDTEDARKVFQNPMKIRRFFEVIRFLFPEFDAEYAAVSRLSHMPLETSRHMWKFIQRLSETAQSSLSYFFDIEPERHPHLTLTTRSIFNLEDRIARTIWRTFDSPKADRTYDYDMKTPARDELYVMFMKRVRTEYRTRVHAAMNWKLIEEKYSKPVPMHFIFSATDIALRDPFERAEAYLSVRRWRMNLGRRYKFLTLKYWKKGLPEEWFHEEDA